MAKIGRQVTRHVRVLFLVVLMIFQRYLCSVGDIFDTLQEHRLVPRVGRAEQDLRATPIVNSAVLQRHRLQILGFHGISLRVILIQCDILDSRNSIDQHWLRMVKQHEASTYTLHLSSDVNLTNTWCHRFEAFSNLSLMCNPNNIKQPTAILQRPSPKSPNTIRKVLAVEVLLAKLSAMPGATSDSPSSVSSIGAT